MDRKTPRQFPDTLSLGTETSCGSPTRRLQPQQIERAASSREEGERAAGRDHIPMSAVHLAIEYCIPEPVTDYATEASASGSAESTCRTGVETGRQLHRATKNVRESLSVTFDRPVRICGRDQPVQPRATRRVGHPGSTRQRRATGPIGPRPTPAPGRGRWHAAPEGRSRALNTAVSRARTLTIAPRES